MNETSVNQRKSDGRVALKPILRRIPSRLRAKTAADYAAFLSSAGGWKGLVDVEKLIKDTNESRRLSARPRIER